MQTITLTKDSFEALIGFAYLDGALKQIDGGKIKPSDYIPVFYENYSGSLKANEAIIGLMEESKKLRQERDSLNTIKEEI